jgi:hypothetical protein
VSYDITTSVAEAVVEMANTIKLDNYQTFTLYEATRPINFKVPAGDTQPEEHMLLDENRWVAHTGPKTQGNTRFQGGTALLVLLSSTPIHLRQQNDGVENYTRVHRWAHMGFVSRSIAAMSCMCRADLCCHLLCCRYLADIVSELRHPRVAKEGVQTRLLFKKRMFRSGLAR